MLDTGAANGDNVSRFRVFLLNEFNFRFVHSPRRVSVVIHYIKFVV